jgi:radical SAM superfamily enzyme YgiQ (UPF0313 family)
MKIDACKVLMIFPRFNTDSFWNYRATCELSGARYPAAPLGLITVAALLPQSWEVRLVNRNTESLTEADLEWADLVMTGGMLFQQPDTLLIIDMCRARGRPVVVGGPDVTSTPDIYSSANFRVLGEAEEIMDDFIAAWQSGAEQGFFQAPMGQTDVTKSPTPRFDLLKLGDYLHVGIQFSRGCPFNCEFCDIIELYGRVPRTKTNEQVLAELDALYALGYRGHVDFVDDNLIGNKKALKKFLPELQSWMNKKKFPFEFTTEASINLADDPELLGALAAANFFGVFVGIESPDTDTLVLMRKKQNTRRSLQESIHKIYSAGIIVFAGFIVGFDSEKGSTAEGMIECIEDTAIPVCTVGLLYALPATQLGRRLLREGRLFSGYDAPSPQTGDQCTTGLNFETKRPRREVLADYRAVLDAVYDPAAYFGRARRVGRMLRCGKRRFKASLPRALRDLRMLGRLVRRLPGAGPKAAKQFWKTMLDCAIHNPTALPYLVMFSALYLHHGPFSRQVIAEIDRQVEDIDLGRWSTPLLAPAEDGALSVA